MKVITYVSLALSIFLLLYFALHILSRRRLAVHQRLSDIESISLDEETAVEGSLVTRQRWEDNKLFRLPIVGSYFNKTNEQLIQAHILLKTSEYLLLSILMAGIFFFLVFGFIKNPLVGVLPAFIGFFIPKLYIMAARDKRARQLNKQLPEFLNILSNALRAGLSFSQAIATTGNEMTDPIKWEFQKVLRDNNLGRPMEDALTELVNRTGDEDIEMFVTAIIIQRQVGGNLSEVLDMIANTIRERVKLKGEVRTLSAQSRMSALIIGVLPVAIALILSIINPNYLKPLFTETLGQILLASAAIMVIVGALVLKKIANLEV